MPAAHYICDKCGRGRVLYWSQWEELDKTCDNVKCVDGTMVREKREPMKILFEGEAYKIPHRDSQKQKLYDAEREAFGPGFSNPPQLVPIEQMQRRADEITGSKRWSDLIARYNRNCWSRNRQVKIGDGSGCRTAFYRMGEIEMPHWSRTEPILLHELAHAATPGLGHQWPFARTYIDLVSTFVGVEAARRLKEAFRKHGVRWTPKAKRVMSPEAKARLAERGRQALAAYAARKKGGAA